MAKVELKQPIVTEIAEAIRDAQAVMLVGYQGLTVEQDMAMRREFRENNVTYKIFKNTLMNRAFAGTPCEALAKDLKGPNALAVSHDDPAAPARIVAKYAKQYKTLTMVGGVIEGKYVGAEGLVEVSQIPTREVLLGRLFGSMQSPITNLARVLKQIAEKDGEAAPEAEAPAAE